MPSNRLAKFIAAVALVLLLLGLVGCDEVPTTTSDSGTSGEATEAGDEAAPKPLDLTIGAPADYGDYTVTVDAASPGPVDYDGGPTYKVTVTYVNNGSEAVSFNPFDWYMENASGVRTQNTAIIEGSPESLSSGELAPGGSLTGDIYFEGGEAAKILYEPSLFAGEENMASWVVQ